MNSAPRGIPIRLVYRMCADILFALGRRTEGRRGGAESQRTVAREYFADAEQFALIYRDGKFADRCADAAVVGYLLAWLTGDKGSFAELRAELEDIHGVDILQGINGRDRQAIVSATLGPEK